MRYFKALRLVIKNFSFIVKRFFGKHEVFIVSYIRLQDTAKLLQELRKSDTRMRELSATLIIRDGELLHYKILTDSLVDIKQRIDALNGAIERRLIDVAQEEEAVKEYANGKSFVEKFSEEQLAERKEYEKQELLNLEKLAEECKKEE